MPLGVLVAPENAMRGEAEAEHFVVEVSEVRGFANDGGGRSVVTAGRDVEQFFAIGDAYRAENLIAPGDESQTVGNAGRAMDVAACSEFPMDRAGARRDA